MHSMYRFILFPLHAIGFSLVKCAQQPIDIFIPSACNWFSPTAGPGSFTAPLLTVTVGGLWEQILRIL